ncbi:MAG: histidine phosphatase family protein [Deltaproteobacteria bacterium]|nr:histidine phosphatase family protein [Deltaproteobacteria bacterium]
MTEFFLFRHGETDWNNQGRLQGSANIPLNKTGVKQAEALRDFFDSWRKQTSSRPEMGLVSSDLDRAIATARIAFRFSAEDSIQTDPRFRETHMGLAEGLTYQEVIDTFGKELWLSWIGLGSSSWHARFPEGESKGEVRDRALAGLMDLTIETANDQKVLPPAQYAIATHGGLLRRILHHLHPEEPKPIDVVNGSVFRFWFQDGILQADKTPVFEP